MISRLHGTLVELEPTQAVIDCGGVGYAVTLPVSTYDRMPAIGGLATLYIHFSVREDAIQLFGFATVEERELYRLLLGVSGIGPRLALNVLSTLPVATFCRAVADGDTKALLRISGIGKRVAERLTVELRDRIKTIDPTAGLGQGEKPALPPQAEDAVAALETLGFRNEQARKAVERVAASEGSNPSAEEMIRKALARLNT